MIVANPDVLKDNVLVEPLYREKEVREISYWLKLSLEEPVVLMVYGLPGVGKTTTSRWVMEKLSEEMDVPVVYINALVVSRPSEIARLVSLQRGKSIPFRGISREELVSRLRRLTPFSIVVDEADALSPRAREFIRLFVKSTESFKDNVGVVFISNRFFHSPYVMGTLRFNPYSYKQLKHIFKERARMAFFPNSYEEEAIEKVAAFVYKYRSNVRLGLHLLRVASRYTDYLTVDDIERSKSRLFSFYIEKRFSFLSGIEKQIVEFVKSKGVVTTNELYEYIRNVFHLSDRMVRNYVRELTERGILECRDYFTKNGRVRFVRISLGF